MGGTRLTCGAVSLAAVQAEPEPATGFLVVRASGAAAAAAAMAGAGARPESVQLLMRCPIRCAMPVTATAAGCSLIVQPAGEGQAVVMLTAAGLSIGFGELRPLMFQPVRVEPPLRSLFTGAVVHVLAAVEVLEPHGLEHHLRGLAELVVRSALRAELNRVDARQSRRREALAYIRTNLADPDLDADRVAAALFMGGTQTRADKANEAVGLIEAEIKRLAEQGPTSDELEKSKSYLKGSYPLNFDTSTKIAGQLVQLQVDDLGIDYWDRRNGLIDSVTLEDVKRVASRLLNGGVLFTVVGRTHPANAAKQGG